jgi:two-component system, sensor histidine kinase ChiS
MCCCPHQARKNVEVLNRVPESLPHIFGDSGRIVQILYNLLGNSCKFTHKGSIAIDAALKGVEVEVTVRDTGIGIPTDKQGIIFGFYEQVPPAARCCCLPISVVV